jgi:hypothetical protein
MVGVVTKPDANCESMSSASSATNLTLERRGPSSRRAKLRELLRRADGVGFDAAVAQIANEAAETEALGFGDGEETEADSLHAAGDEEASCFFCVVHKL